MQRITFGWPWALLLRARKNYQERKKTWTPEYKNQVDIFDKILNGLVVEFGILTVLAVALARIF